MGYAYTPGLTVSSLTRVRKVRRLPLKGRVLVQVGQRVEADTIVAETLLPGPVQPLNVVGKLGIDPEELPQVMLKHPGQPVSANEPIARTRGLFGLFRSQVCSPIAGTVESVSSVTGQVIIRGPAVPLRRHAYAAGTVVAVEPEESATIEVCGSLIQGIFGIGGETHGPLELLVDGPDEVLDAAAITAAQSGKVIVAGSLVTAEAVRQAVRCGVRGIVTGGLDDADLRAFLGYELGVAITGEESLGVTIVVTEGFGRIRMARGTFELLRERAGRRASINGTTQIRAGVIRPEVLIPLDEPVRPSEHDGHPESALAVGARVRAIREPFFGCIGRCLALPVELEELESESRARVLEVEFEDGRRAVLPRANVELIQE